MLGSRRKELRGYSTANCVFKFCAACSSCARQLRLFSRPVSIAAAGFASAMCSRFVSLMQMPGSSLAFSQSASSFLPIASCNLQWQLAICITKEASHPQDMFHKSSQFNQLRLFVRSRHAKCYVHGRLRANLEAGYVVRHIVCLLTIAFSIICKRSLYATSL